MGATCALSLACYAEFARACEEGCAEAWRVLTERFQPLLVGVARQRGATEDAGNECAGDVISHMATPSAQTGTRTVIGGYSGAAMVGTPETIADEMQEWLETRGSDGFTVMFSHLPGGLDDFCQRVVPELQRRGLFRTEYEGATLRENLGLPRPANRFF